MKAASVNGHFDVECHVTHDHLDDLLEAMKLHHGMFNEVCGLTAYLVGWLHVMHLGARSMEKRCRLSFQKGAGQGS